MRAYLGPVSRVTKKKEEGKRTQHQLFRTVNLSGMWTDREDLVELAQAAENAYHLEDSHQADRGGWEPSLALRGRTMAQTSISRKRFVKQTAGRAWRNTQPLLTRGEGLLLALLHPVQMRERRQENFTPSTITCSCRLVRGSTLGERPKHVDQTTQVFYHQDSN